MKARSGDRYCSPVNKARLEVEGKRKGRDYNYKTSLRGLGFMSLSLVNLALQMAVEHTAMHWEQGMFDVTKGCTLVVLSRCHQWLDVDQPKKDDK